MPPVSAIAVQINEKSFDTNVEPVENATRGRKKAPRLVTRTATG
jgi:hypothetical protein